MGESTREGVPRHTPLGELGWAHYGDRYVGLGTAYAFSGQPEEARRAFAEARSRFKMLGNFSTLGVLSALELLNVSLPYFTDQLDEQRLLAQQAAEAWRNAALVNNNDPLIASLPTLRLIGEWSAARSTAQREYQRQVNAWSAAISSVTLVDLALRQGEPELGRTIVRAILPEGPGTEFGTVPLVIALPLQRLAFETALVEHDAGTMRAWLEAHDRWLEWSGAVLGRAEGALRWAQFHHAGGDVSSARQQAEHALSHATEPRQPLALIAIHRFLGQLDTEARQFDAAEEHLQQSLKLADACQAPFERALTLLELARLRAAQEKPDEARALLDEVRMICEPLGARPTLARAEAELAHLPAT